MDPMHRTKVIGLVWAIGGQQWSDVRWQVAGDRWGVTGGVWQVGSRASARGDDDIVRRAEAEVLPDLVG